MSRQQADLREQLAHARLGAWPRRRRCRCTCSGSAMISPTVMRGLSERVGVLEDHLHAPAHLAHASAATGRVMSSPSNTMLPAVGCSSCSTQRPVVVLPQPDSPTRPERLAAADGEIDAVDRAHRRCAARPAARRRPSKCLTSPATSSSVVADGRSASDCGSCRATLATSVAPTPSRQATWPPGPAASSAGASALAARDATAAARREGAARRQPRQVGRQAVDRVEARAARLVQARHRAQQAERVGMARVGEQLARRRAARRCAPRT